MPAGLAFDKASSDVMSLENRAGVGGWQRETKRNMFAHLRALIANEMLKGLVQKGMH